MRILHVVGSLAVGGAEQLTARLLDGFKQLGHDVAAVSLFDTQNSHLERFLKQQEIPIHHLRKRIGFDPRALTGLGQVIRQFQPDIVHSHGYVLAYTLVVATLAGVPGQVHTIHNVAGWDMPWWGRPILSLAALIGVAPVAVSAEVARTTRSANRIEALVIPNGIPVESYRTAGRNRKAWRTENGFDQDDLLVVSVARLSPQKHHSLLLRAFARLPQNQSTQLILVGDGPLKGALQREADALGIRGQVRFLGIREDVPDILAASDIFALSSDAEGNPLALMEAMAAGLPVVATAVGGVRELLTHGRDGFVVQPRNTDSLAAALSRLIGSPEQRQSMGRDAESKAIATFDIAHTIRSYIEVYEKLISGVRGPRPGQARTSPSRQQVKGS